MAALPQALQQPMQAQPVLLHFERWLILLKARPAAWLLVLPSLWLSSPSDHRKAGSRQALAALAGAR
jgi:hypothetical protein